MTSMILFLLFTMDGKKDSNVPKMRHFAKLHERIQDKYNEMQKKLEKSKSVDSLLFADDDNLHQENMKSSSTQNLLDEVFEYESKDNNLLHAVIVENVKKIEVTYSTLEPKVSFSESDLSVDIGVPSSTDLNNDNKNELIPEQSQEVLNEWIFPRNSINETDKAIDKKIEDATPTDVPITIPTDTPTGTPKSSIRNKIGSRVSAVRERRREAKERKRLKNKLEIFETGSRLSLSSKSDIHLPKDKRFKLATVSIALIEIEGLELEYTDDKIKHLQCRFRLGNEKHKSKSAKYLGSPILKWQELFNMYVYDVNNTRLEIWLLDSERKDFIGRTTIDIWELEKEKTHRMKLPLEGDIGTLFLLLTVTGSPFDDLLIDHRNYQEYQMKLQQQEKAYSYLRPNNSIVGHLSVIVYGAKGLATSDCYCTLKLVNERRQTHAEYKTNDPNWIKTFTFDVNDVTSILLVTIVDEKKDEEVGRVLIPLLTINNDSKVWYALKDETARERAKGNNPRVLLEMKISWNTAKASMRVIKPKEVDLLETEDKLDRKVFFKLVARAKVVVFWTLDFCALLKSCFEWESRKSNTIFLILWLLFIWYFKPWMVPLLLLIPFIWYRPPNYYLYYWKPYMIRPSVVIIDKHGRRSIRQKINNLQDLLYSVQKFIAKVASFGESVKNLVNFTVPYVSFLAIFFIISISIFIYLVPVRYILMGWGVKKYVRKIIWPNRVPHSEVFDLISRVPDDEALIDYEELDLDLTPGDRLNDKEILKIFEKVAISDIEVELEEEILNIEAQEST